MVGYINELTHWVQIFHHKEVFCIGQNTDI